MTAADAIRDALACFPADDCPLAERVGAALKAEFGDAGFDIWSEWNRRAGFDDEPSLRDLWPKLNGHMTIEELIEEAINRGFKPAELQRASPAAQSAADAAPARREPPYPATVKARGWRFDLDVERIEASDAWALAASSGLQPWLLMLWYTAWRSIPVGTLPADDALIAARLGMQEDRFASSRTILMRGWWQASDGLLYHPVITERVLTMLNHVDEFKRRQSEAGRASAAARRQKYGTAQPKSEPAPEPAPNRIGTGPNAAEPIPTPTPTTTSPSPIGEGVSPASPPTRTPASRQKVIPDCPHQHIIDLYHELLPANPRVREWNETRRAYLRARWREKAKPNGTTQGYTTVEDGLAWWRAFFGYVADSPFLTGRTSGRDGRPPFVADLAWLIKPENFAKVIDGKYHG